MKHCLPLWLLLFLLLQWPGAARATAGPPATGRPLAEALNPDGTLRAGAHGSFDARAFRMRTAPDGRPVFQPAGALGAGDERWQDGFGLPNGTDGTVFTVVRVGNDLYIGGKFGIAGGVMVNNVAKWNGVAWSALGAGLGTGGFSYVYALAVAGNGDVYVGGSFTLAGGAAASSVTKWNGTSWNGLGTGVYVGVDALVLAPTGKVYAGGGFTATGDGSKVMAHFGIYDPAVPLATAAAKATPAAQLFPNPAHGTATLRLPATAPRQPLMLTDALGRLVRQYPAEVSAEAVLDLRGLPAGVYVVRCGELSQRLVVE